MNRRPPFLALLCFSLLLSAPGAHANAPRTADQQNGASSGLEYMPDRVVIQLRSSSMSRASARLQSGAASSGAALGIPSIDAVSTQVGAISATAAIQAPMDATKASRLGLDRWVLVTLAPGSNVEAAVRAYAADPNVERAQPDMVYQPAVTPTDPAYSQHWGHNNTAQLPGYDWAAGTHTLPGVGTVGFDANAQAGWSGPSPFGSASVIIAIIDSGVNLSHPDLDVVAGWDFGSNDNNPEDNSSQPGHGTACAGVAAAKANNGLGACGSAPGCKIMPVKVANNSGIMSATTIANGITWAADNGADIISMSLGARIPYDAIVAPAIDYAAAADVTMLAATGNDNAGTLQYPAIHPSVIGVGAASPCGDRKRSSSSSADLSVGSPVHTDPNSYTCDGERWWGANYGTTTQDDSAAVDILGPTILYTTDIQGALGHSTGDYTPFFNGTSAATPYVAGVCALIKSKHPDWTAAQIRQQLLSTAQDVVNIESAAGWDQRSGYGMVDINGAFGCSAGPSIVAYDLITRSAGEGCCAMVYPLDLVAYVNDPDGDEDIASVRITKVDNVTMDVDSVAVCGAGAHQVRVTVTDYCGNTASAWGYVAVQNTAPVAAAKDISRDADNACCTVVHVTNIDDGSYDADGNASLCITDLDGEAVTCADSVIVCGTGTHYVTLTITDQCNSTASAVAEVDVNDVTPPSLTVVMDRDALWPPNHKMVEVCAEVTAVDNCDANPTVALVSVTSNEPDNDKGDGNTVGDIDGAEYGTLDTCFDLRSERMGTETGRRYTIVYSASDVSGNTVYDTVQVDVPHDQSSAAIASSGFTLDGTALKPGASTFALFIPGSATLSAGRIDTRDIYVGNTAGVIKATDTRVVDVNNDQKADLAVMFDADATQVAGLLSTTDAAVFTMGEELDAKTITDGPVGLHFKLVDGTNYLASNIYALGVPVAMPEPTGKKEVTPETQAITPKTDPAAATATQARITALTSIQPNPFNPQTTVHFTLATSERVRIAIYDVRGSLVRNLVDETMSAGQHQARWDGTSDKGAGVTSGIYFVRMVAGSYTEVRKIVMLK